MEKWQDDWRDNIAPKLTPCGLKELLAACEARSPSLIKGESIADSDTHGEPRSYCPIAYALVRGGRETPCTRKEWVKLKEDVLDAGDGWFIDWFDARELTETLPLLAAEVRRSLAEPEGEA